MTLTISIHDTIGVRSANVAYTLAVPGNTINATSAPASNVRLWG